MNFVMDISMSYPSNLLFTSIKKAKIIHINQIPQIGRVHKVYSWYDGCVVTEQQWIYALGSH